MFLRKVIAAKSDLHAAVHPGTSHAIIKVTVGISPTLSWPLCDYSVPFQNANKLPIS